VVIANGEPGKEADPLSAAGLAGAYDAPVLLVQASRMPASTKTAITEIAAKRKAEGKKLIVHLIGGTASVPDARWNEIKAIPGVSTTKDRIAGADRYSVSAAIATRMVSVGADVSDGVILIAADNPAAFYDALAASPIAYARTMPMLSVRKTSVPASVAAVLKTPALATKPRYAASSATYLGAAAIGTATRLTTSANRFTAAKEIATKATGKGWVRVQDTGIAAKLPDALTGGTYLGRRGGVMLFTESTPSIQSSTSGFIGANRLQILDGWVIGGPGSVPEAQVKSFETLLK